MTNEELKAICIELTKKLEELERQHIKLNELVSILAEEHEEVVNSEVQSLDSGSNLTDRLEEWQGSLTYEQEQWSGPVAMVELDMRHWKVGADGYLEFIGELSEQEKNQQKERVLKYCKEAFYVIEQPDGTLAYDPGVNDILAKKLEGYGIKRMELLND